MKNTQQSPKAKSKSAGGVESSHVAFLRGVMIGMDKALAVAQKRRGDIVAVMAAADRAAEAFERAAKKRK